MKKQYLWKVFKADFGSNNGDIQWKIGEWQKYNGVVHMCHAGFHASPRIIDAMQYTNAEIITKVEVRGKSEKQKDKEVWSEMQIIKAWKWEKKDSVELAIFAAEKVLKSYEEKYPNDDRPKKAIEAAKAWLKDPTEKTRNAAYAAANAAYAYAANAAYAAAAYAAYAAAAYAAGGANAYAAYAYAAYAAYAANAAAAYAANAAAAYAVLDECEKFILKKLKTSEVICQKTKSQ